MALDQNLFTLKLEPSKAFPNGVDLVEPSGTVHYRKIWVPNDKEAYCFSLCDPVSESVLATVTAPSATSKQKLIELHNPSVSIHLNYTGLLSFKWTFTWEGNQFDWKREECYMIRKPDPPVLVAVTKEPPGKIKTSSVQILDYNINRFDIQDRKGLEIAILTSLLTFPDYSEQLKAKPPGSNPLPPPPIIQPQPPPRPQPALPAGPPPPPPPKPEGWAEDQVAILQAKEQRDVNEIVVGNVGSLDDYVQHCVSVLSDETLLYITLRSRNTTDVPRVVQVAEATKRLWYKTSGYDEELHQYVNTGFEGSESETRKGKGRRIINLNDPSIPSTSAQPTPSYEPPSSLTIHLSKISMPELEPKTKENKPKFVIKEPSPERRSERTNRGHHQGHKHHVSELTLGSQRISNHDTKGKSHHHHHSQELGLLRSSSSANLYTSKLSPTSGYSSSPRPNLKLLSSSNTLTSSSSSKPHTPRPLPVSPASSVSSPSPSGALNSSSSVVHYSTVYPKTSIPSPAPPSRGAFWKRW